MEIISGIVKSAQKVVVYGPEGVGKSTFASHFPTPIFIDTEGSTKKLNVVRTPKPTSWAMLLDYVKSIAKQRKWSTLVIDTVDWAEQLCLQHILSTYNKKGIEDFGYGNGYVYEKEEFGRFLNLLQDVVDSGINVVLTAHAQMRKFEQPDEAGAYDRWELKLGKKTASQISPLVKEWADTVLFVNYKTLSVATDDKGKKFKAQGGKRIMYAAHHPCWDAKNRDGLPAENEFDYSVIAPYVPNMLGQVIADEPVKQENATAPVVTATKPQKQEPVQQSSPVQNETPFLLEGIPKPLLDLMNANRVTPEEIQKVVADQGFFPEDTPIQNYGEEFTNFLISIWDKAFGSIQENRKLPFEA